MKIIDMHCDTITEIMKQNKVLSKNDLNIDIEKLSKGDVICQFFAIFTKLSDYASLDDAWNYVKLVKKFFDEQIEANKDNIIQVKNYNEIIEAEKNNKIGAMLTIEEGGIVNNKIERIYELFQMGVRLITLTWNFDNCMGYPNSDTPKIMNAGLTNFGKECVELMNNLGIIIDVSHMSDGCFWDVVKLSKKPFIASHSNARTIKNCRRNISDDMLKALADKGGIIGINFYNKFLGDDVIGTISEMVQHIKHIKKVAGIDVLGIGSDFDGFEGVCEISRSDHLYKLVEALHNNGFSNSELEKITYLNALRIIKEIVG